MPKPSRALKIGNRRLHIDPLEDRRLLATLTVNTELDGINYGDSVLTLREAVAIINQGSSSTSPTLSAAELLQIDEGAGNEFGVNDTLLFAPGLDGDTIELTEPVADRQISIDVAVRIDATALNSLTIDAEDPNGGSSRIFNVGSSAVTPGVTQPVVTFAGMTLQGGDADGAFARRDGGAISANAPIALDRMTFIDNGAQRDGGAVHVDVAEDYEGQALWISDSTFSNNRSGRHGGALAISNGFATAVDNGDKQTFLIESSQFTNNQAGPDTPLVGAPLRAGANGGAIHAHVAKNDEVDIVASVISGNSAGRDGGGLYVLTEPVLLADSRNISGPVSYHEKAVDARVSISRSLITNNDASSRGGGLFTRQGSGSTVELRESVVSGNTAGIESPVRYSQGDGLPYAGGGVYAYLFSGDREIANLYSTIDGVDDNRNATLLISGSTVSGNEARTEGGGIAICAKWEDDELPEDERTDWSAVSITNSTVSGNIAQTGGGVFLSAFPFGTTETEGLITTITNSTITKNRVVERSGLPDNSVGEGAGIYSYKNFGGEYGSDATMDTRLLNTIVAGNFDDTDGSADNYYGTIHAKKTFHNLFGAGNSFFEHTGTYASISVGTTSGLLNPPFGAGNQLLTDNNPQLEDLADNGGLSLPGGVVIETHMPLTGSPVIDNGSGAVANDPLSGTQLCVDQRVHDRFVDIADVGASGPEAVDIGAVEFGALAILPGDYNRDFSVDAADYTVWRDAFQEAMNGGGTLSAPFCGADGNGDGLITEADYQVWATEYGASNPIPPADYDGDGVVNAADYTVWRDAFSSGQYNAAADGNDDGVINAVDWFLWKETYGSTTGLAVFSFFAAPTPYLYEVSLFTDEWDGDYSANDLSLREAIHLANTAGGPATVILPTGRYDLTRVGWEPTNGHDTSKNDLNILGDVRVLGDGAGLSVINLDNLIVNAHRRAFDVAGTGQLTLDGVTIANADVYFSYKGAAVEVDSGGALLLTNSAIVANRSQQQGTAVYSVGGDVTIRRSVFTNNESVYKAGQAVYAIPDGSVGGSLTIGESIFAINWDQTPGQQADAFQGSDPNVWVLPGVTLINEGKNLYDDATGGFFDTTPGVGDHLGTPDYVVSTLVDEFDHVNDLESLSLREAIDLANLNPGQKEIWLPAWQFELTRDRGSYGGGSATDTDVSFGDLDIKDQLTIRGIDGETAVRWEPGVVDSVFDLLGDANNDGLSDQNTNTADYTVWADQNGSGSGTPADWEIYSADFDDDGDVDAADHAIWSSYHGNSLDLFDIAIG